MSKVLERKRKSSRTMRMPPTCRRVFRRRQRSQTPLENKSRRREAGREGGSERARVRGREGGREGGKEMERKRRTAPVGALFSLEMPCMET
jgi:hypothetical protein